MPNPLEMNLQNAIAGQNPEFTQNVMGGVGGIPQFIQDKTKNDKMENAAKNLSFTARGGPNGTEVDVHTDFDTLKSIGEAAKAYQGIRAEYDKMLAQNAQQQAALRQHPFANTLAQIAAGLAANDVNPVTRGIGQAATRLNPTGQELNKERMGLLQGQEGAIQGQMAGAGQVARLGMEQQQFNLANTRENRLASMAQASGAAKTFKELSAAAQKGELTDAGLTSEVLQNEGHPKEKADAQAKTLVAISKEKQALVAAAAAATDKRTQDQLNARATESDKRLSVMLKGLSLKASDKTEADKAVEETAQALAPMNKDSLNAMTQVAGMFGSARNKIFARARELNPHFNTAELGRMTEMEKSFTSGKDSVNVQSFDTFLQHAGELHDTINNLYQSGSPALNKPINWIRKNAEGNPEYQKLLVAIEPVGKEFESFLLNQRALYVDDRKQIDTLLNGNSSPAQIKAALGQMGKTAKDRFAAMNQRYKRVMHEDIADPFSGEARDAAKKIGIDLPKGADSGAGKKADPLRIR